MKNKIFNLVLLPVIILLFINGCDRVSGPETQTDSTDFPNYELVWSDEFNEAGSELDSEKWGYDLGYGGDGWGNDEWQEYTSDPENVKVEDGKLVILAVWDSVNYTSPGKRDGSVTSSRVNTKDKFSFKFGKIQSRIKAPVGMGMWPAFWLLGSSFDGAGWPYCGEIDIMEMSPLYHGSNTTMCTLHWWNDIEEYHESYGTTRELSTSLGDDYHVFEVEWDEQRVVGRIDDITYYVKLIDPATMDEFLRKFFIILNVAVGGNLGGTPDVTTEWPQKMYVDWVRVYQGESDTAEISSYGIFTDETVVDAGLTVGLNAEIYVWENTLEAASIAPFEGDNVIAWSTTGVGWFGGGISSNVPVDLSGFAEGNLKFMIKMPANVGFKIGINDISAVESYVDFPANQTAYGLVRNGEWGQAVIPIAELKGSVDLSLLSYEFIILEENGTACQFAIDDIYWDGGGTTAGSVSFDADTYSVDDTMAEISVTDEAAANDTISVSVDNGSETISIDIILDGDGEGTGTLNFGLTNDDNDTIEITNAVAITAFYTDASGTERTDFAAIDSGSPDSPEAAAPTPTQNAENVISLFSNAYPNVTVDTWSADWDNADVEDIQINGNDTKKYTNLIFAGIEFTSQTIDASAMTNFCMDVWTSDPTATAAFKIKLVDFGADGVWGGDDVEQELSFALAAGEWVHFDIPIADFTGLTTTEHMAQLVISADPGPSTVYMDNIYFYSEEQSTTVGIYSESHIDPMLAYIQIWNSADWGGNVVDVDLESTEVVPVDGSFVMSLDFNSGSSWGGIAYDYGVPGADMTAYSTFVINIDKSEMSEFDSMKIKLEHTQANSFEIETGDYTPIVNGNWARYEIPLSDFTGVDLSEVHFLVLSNPQNDTGTVLFGKLYFDDIYLEAQ
ncbi:MAG: glycoside hydrolase family 16 protein [Candidatus Cloacimonetes bacterium]|nr:glycoside hydrolase family 16 protein [Candidatus Cloacimonadota bacterium]